MLWCKQSNLMTVILSLANLKLFLICPEILIKTTQQGLRFFFFPAGKISFLSVQIERMIFLSVSKLASLGPCSEMVMSTLQNRDKSHLAKTEKERKMVVNGISLLKKKKKFTKKSYRQRALRVCCSLGFQLRLLQGHSSPIKLLGRRVCIYVCVYIFIHIYKCISL